MNNSFNPNGLLPEYMDLYEKEEINIIGNNLSDHEEEVEPEEVIVEKQSTPKTKVSSFNIIQLTDGFEVTIPVQKVWNKRINVNIENNGVLIKIMPKTYSEDDESFSKRFPLPKSLTKRTTKVQTKFIKGTLVVTVTPK